MISLPLVLWACSTPARNLSVTLDDFRTGATLQLANESHQDFQDIYSLPRGEANLKLVPDRVMRELVARLESEGLDRYARPASELDADAAGYSGMITVATDDRRRVFALTRSRNKTVEQAMSFIRMKQMIHELFSQAFALQAVENPAGDALFEQEQRRLEEQRAPRRDDSRGHPGGDGTPDGGAGSDGAGRP